jgi:hypothetical protein
MVSTCRDALKSTMQKPGIRWNQRTRLHDRDDDCCRAVAQRLLAFQVIGEQLSIQQ